jgi:TM2 domain-containing membrane protein YozV
MTYGPQEPFQSPEERTQSAQAPYSPPGQPIPQHQQQHFPQPVQPGYPQQHHQQGPVIAPRSPALGLILSFFIPGLGSMVNGNVGIGVTILLLYILGVILSIFLIGIPIAVGVWIWGLVDGYQSAQKWNAAHGIIS